jgi:hypothetical protein
MLFAEYIGSDNTQTGRQTALPVHLQRENLYFTPPTTSIDIIAFWENEKFTKPEIYIIYQV